MKSLLTRITNRPDPEEDDASGLMIQPVVEPPRPDTHIYAVGDVHGRADLVEPLLERIDSDIDRRGADDAHVVFLGDYIDRGARSADVLAILRRLTELYETRAVCLMGNHERMMLDFLDDSGAGGFWLRNGGVATVESFGLSGVTTADAESPDRLAEVQADLLAALPDGLEAWLRGLPLSWQNGSVWAVHAAADPALPMERQPARALLWGHGSFGRRARGDGAWVVHGHTVVPEPKAAAGRVSVDTGAVFTGRLTTAVITPAGEVDFLSVGEGGQSD